MTIFFYFFFFPTLAPFLAEAVLHTYSLAQDIPTHPLAPRQLWTRDGINQYIHDSPAYRLSTYPNTLLPCTPSPYLASTTDTPAYALPTQQRDEKQVPSCLGTQNTKKRNSLISTSDNRADGRQAGSHPPLEPSKRQLSYKCYKKTATTFLPAQRRHPTANSSPSHSLLTPSPPDLSTAGSST